MDPCPHWKFFFIIFIIFCPLLWKRHFWPILAYYPHLIGDPTPSMAMTTLVTSHLTNWSKKLAPYCDLQRNCNFLCWWSICSFLAILATFARVVLLMRGTYLLSYIHPVQKIKASSFGDFCGFLGSPNHKGYKNFITSTIVFIAIPTSMSSHF